MTRGLIFAGTVLAAWAASADDFGRWSVTVPEQRQLNVRQPGEFRPARMPASTPPPTVAPDSPPVEPWNVSLDDIIQQALVHSQVVRVVQGLTAGSSGKSLYDAAVTNTKSDEQRGRFDPNFSASVLQTHNESPFFNSFTNQAIAFPFDIETRNLSLSKTNAFGGSASTFINDTSFTNSLQNFGLNPRHLTSAGIAYSQPLLQGAGRKANLAPILIARIDTERSFFDLKDSLQEMVRGTIETYWSLMAARADLWAREQQVQQGRFAAELARSRHEVGLADISEVSQAELARANFEAALITAQASVYQKEALLRNLIGLPPGDWRQIVPVSPPRTDTFTPDWDLLTSLAESSRPDIIQLKLILEADEQNLVIAKNQRLPRADATANYRWNGISGRLPEGPFSEFGDFKSWSLGINFAVPLGLRQSRANVRNKELVISRDRANLEQGLHNAIHRIGLRYRQVAQAYAQYLAFREVREIAKLNLERQFEQHRSGRAIFLNVLQAITDWGNAVRQEAEALGAFNSELAGLERETGTILEEHGVRMVEERHKFAGPLFVPKFYPSATPPTVNGERYGAGEEPSERAILPGAIPPIGVPLQSMQRGIRPTAFSDDAATAPSTFQTLDPDDIFGPP